MSVERPRVVLADDQPPLRAAVRKVLEADGFEVRGEAETTEDCLRLVLDERPDICMVALRLPGSLPMIARVTDEHEGTGAVVVVLTASRSTENMIAAIRAGASGYLLKDMNPQRIPAALRGVLNGEAAMPRTLVVRLIKEIQRPRRGPMLHGQDGLVELSPRQWEVLNLMADRLGTAEIGEQLQISPVTVRRHVAAVVAKLGVADREAAVAVLRGNR